MNFALVPRMLFDADWSMAHGYDPHRFFTLLSNTFLHGGVFHIFTNMWTLWIFGDNVESRMGHFRYLLFYLLCGIAASGTHAVLYPQSTVPALGASGAIAAVMGAYMMMFPLSRIVFFVPVFIFPFFFEWPAVLFIGFWFFMQFLMGSSALMVSQDVSNIAFWAHIGGFLSGVLVYRLFLIGTRDPDYPDEYYTRYVSYGR